MIEIGKNFFTGLTSAQQQARQNKLKNKALTSQVEQELSALQQEYENMMNYLFRSSVEKNQLASQRALAQLAALQAKRAANGIDAGSAFSVDEKQTSALRQQLDQQTLQRQLQQTAAQENATFTQKWQALWQAMQQYRKQARKNRHFSAIGKAFISLFK